MARPGTFQPGNKLATREARAAQPRGRFITQRLIAMMHEEITHEVLDPNDPKQKRRIKERTTRLNAYCQTLMDLAIGGDMQAIKYIADRIEGTPIATTVTVEDFDPEKLAQERERLNKTRENIAKMTDAERTALYFQTLKSAPGIGGQTKPN